MTRCRQDGILRRWLCWCIVEATLVSSELSDCFPGGDGTPDGQLDVIIGDFGRKGGLNGNGPHGASSLLSGPQGVVLDYEAQLIYVADTGNHAVRSIGLTTDVEPRSAKTIAGTLTRPGRSGDGGKAVDARLQLPKGIALDTVARRLYIADTGNHAVRMVDFAHGTIATVTGQPGTAGDSGDGGRCDKASLRAPCAVAVDSIRKKLYIADTDNHALRVVDLTTGIICTLAGELGVVNLEVPSRSTAPPSGRLNRPAGLVVDEAAGVLYMADSNSHAVRSIDVNFGHIVDPTTSKCLDPAPMNTVIGAVGMQALPSRSSPAVVAPYLGAASRSFDRDYGPAKEVRLRRPTGLALDPVKGVLYLSDAATNVVRQVHLESGMASVATGRPGFVDPRSEDGGPVGLAVDYKRRELLLAETYNHVVRRMKIVPFSEAKPAKATSMGSNLTDISSFSKSIRRCSSA